MMACKHGHGYRYAWPAMQRELHTRNKGRLQGQRYTAWRCGRHWHVSKQPDGHWPPKGRGLDDRQEQERTR